jgi:tetratricopeptide (TPR) repeat protein
MKLNKHLSVLTLALLFVGIAQAEYPGIQNLNNQAKILCSMGNYNESVKLYNQALAYPDIGSNSAGAAFYGLALDYYKIGEYGSAIYYSEQAALAVPTEEQKLASWQLKYASQKALGDLKGAKATDHLIKTYWYGTGYFEGQNTTSEASNIKPYLEPQF